MRIACSDYLGIVCILAEAILRFSAEILNSEVMAGTVFGEVGGLLLLRAL